MKIIKHYRNLTQAYRICGVIVFFVLFVELGHTNEENSSDQQKLKNWVEKLSSENFRERELAESCLREQPLEIECHLRQVAGNLKDPEAKVRLMRIVAHLNLRKKTKNSIIVLATSRRFDNRSFSARFNMESFIGGFLVSSFSISVFFNCSFLDWLLGTSIPFL